MPSRDPMRRTSAITGVLGRERQGFVRDARKPCVKAELRAMVDEGLSLAHLDLAGADLSGMDLSGMDLSGVDLTGSSLKGAKLDGADLCGCRVSGASFANASMRGVAADGLVGEGADFRGMDARALATSEGPDRPSRFRGARLDHADLSGAVLEKASFDDASMNRCSLSRVSAFETSFASARLDGADFSYGTFLRCSMDGVSIAPSSDADLRDRTVGTMAVGCSYAKASLGDARAFRHDAVWGKVRKAVAAGASGFSLFAASKVLHADQVEEAAKFFGEHGPTVLLVAMAASLLKDKVVEGTRDFLGEEWTWVQDSVRAYCKSTTRTSRSVANTVVAMVRGPGAKAVVDALGALQDDRPFRVLVEERTEARVDGGNAVIFASRRQLAKALEALSDDRTPHRRNGDLYVIRADRDPKPTFEADGRPRCPSVVRLAYDGSVSYAWIEGGKVVDTATFDVDDGNVDPASTRGATGWPYMAEFRRVLLSQHGISRVSPVGSEFRAGRDGSLLVVDRATGRIDNPEGPAVVAPDGTTRNFRDGREVETPSLARRPPRKLPSMDDDFATAFSY